MEGRSTKHTKHTNTPTNRQARWIEGRSINRSTKPQHTNKHTHLVVKGRRGEERKEAREERHAQPAQNQEEAAAGAVHLYQRSVGSGKM